MSEALSRFPFAKLRVLTKISNVHLQRENKAQQITYPL